MRMPKQVSESVRYLRMRAGGQSPLYMDHRADPEDVVTFLESYSAAPTTYMITTKENGKTVEEVTTGEDAAQLVTDLSKSRENGTTYAFDSWTEDGHAYARLSASYGDATKPQQLRNQPPLTRQPVDVELWTQFSGDEATADDIVALLSSDADDL